VLDIICLHIRYQLGLQLVQSIQDMLVKGLFLTIAWQSGSLYLFLLEGVINELN
jgi:hypothetical protein